MNKTLTSALFVIAIAAIAAVGIALFPLQARTLAARIAGTCEPLGEVLQPIAEECARNCQTMFGGTVSASGIPTCVTACRGVAMQIKTTQRPECAAIWTEQAEQLANDAESTDME